MTDPFAHPAGDPQEPAIPPYSPPAYGAPPEQGYGQGYTAPPAYGAPQTPYGYAAPQPAYGAPQGYASPQYPQGYGQPQGYGYGYGYPPYAASAGTNGLAVASLVLGILCLFWVGSVLAVVFGHVAYAQCKRTGQGGRGLAVAGLVLGYLWLLLLVGIIVAGASSSDALGAVHLT